MRRRATTFSVFLVIGVLWLVAAACGGGNGADDGGGEGSEIDQVRLALDGAFFMNAAPIAVAAERSWPESGLTAEPEVAVTSEVIPALLGEDVWIGQIESQPLWAALAQGTDELKVIGVEKGYERWILGATPGINEPEDLIGQRVTGGPPGERNVTVMEAMLEEVGIGVDEVDMVTVEGGSDEYFQAMLAGQIVAAPLRDRHVEDLADEGGKVLFEDIVAAPQEVWTTRNDFLEENYDAVRNFLEGVIEAKQWAAEGPEMVDNRDEAFETTEDFGFEPEPGDYGAWAAFIESNWSMTGGASVEAFDQWTSDMTELGIVPEGFEWREHVDFEPLWDAQEALDIEMTPDPSELEG